MGRAGGWTVWEAGAGEAALRGDEARLVIPAATAEVYSDAQICDYDVGGLGFGNRPPLRLRLLARAEGELRGTAGFGFWNQVYVPGRRRFRIPQAIWFFYGSWPNDIALAKGVEGHGWKAAVINARGWPFFALLPFAPLGFAAMRSRALYDRLWPLGQRAIGVAERGLDAGLLREFHAYAIEWRMGEAVFSVDGRVVLRAKGTAQGPLGFIAWVDNQYAVVRPEGRFAWGLVDGVGSQALILRDIEIDDGE